MWPFRFIIALLLAYYFGPAVLRMYVIQLEAPGSSSISVGSASDPREIIEMRREGEEEGSSILTNSLKIVLRSADEVMETTISEDPQEDTWVVMANDMSEAGSASVILPQGEKEHPSPSDMDDSGNGHHPHTTISSKDIIPFANPAPGPVTSAYMMTLTPTGLHTTKATDTSAKHAMVTDTSDNSPVNTKDQEDNSEPAISGKSWKSSGVDRYNTACTLFRELVFTVHGRVKVPSFFNRATNCLGATVKWACDIAYRGTTFGLDIGLKIRSLAGPVLQGIRAKYARLFDVFRTVSAMAVEVGKVVLWLASFALFVLFWPVFLRYFAAFSKAFVDGFPSEARPISTDRDPIERVRSTEPLDTTVINDVSQLEESGPRSVPKLNEGRLPITTDIVQESGQRVTVSQGSGAEMGSPSVPTKETSIETSVDDLLREMQVVCPPVDNHKVLISELPATVILGSPLGSAASGGSGNFGCLEADFETDVRMQDDKKSQSTPLPPCSTSTSGPASPTMSPSSPINSPAQIVSVHKRFRYTSPSGGPQLIATPNLSIPVAQYVTMATVVNFGLATQQLNDLTNRKQDLDGQHDGTTITAGSSHLGKSSTHRSGKRSGNQLSLEVETGGSVTRGATSKPASTGIPLPKDYQSSMPTPARDSTLFVRALNPQHNIVLPAVSHSDVKKSQDTKVSPDAGAPQPGSSEATVPTIDTCATPVGGDILIVAPQSSLRDSFVTSKREARSEVCVPLPCPPEVEHIEAATADERQLRDSTPSPQVPPTDIKDQGEDKVTTEYPTAEVFDRGDHPKQLLDVAPKENRDEQSDSENVQQTTPAGTESTIKPKKKNGKNRTKQERKIAKRDKRMLEAEASAAAAAATESTQPSPARSFSPRAPFMESNYKLVRSNLDLPNAASPAKTVRRQ